MKVETKEMKVLREIFPSATFISDHMNSNQDGMYSVWCFNGFSSWEIEDAETNHGFYLDHISSHITDRGHAETCIGLHKEPYCKNCGQIESHHNAQISATFCWENFPEHDSREYMENPENLKRVWTPETEEERYKKYGKEYYGHIKSEHCSGHEDYNPKCDDCRVLKHNGEYGKYIKVDEDG